MDANSASELQLDWRQLGLRRPENLLVFQVQTTALEAMRGFWRGEGFIEIQSPKLLSGASEGGSEVFRLDYFGRPACLAQSPQLYKQMVMGSGFDRVFEIGPAFRAEMSLTTRHAAEFTSIDTEMAWIDSHEDVMSMQERCLAHMMRIVRERHGAAIEETFGVEVVIPEVPFPRVTIKQAYEFSAAMGYPVPREAKGDLDPEGERRLAQYVKEKLGHEFVFVTDYPISVRPFYHLRPEHNLGSTNSFDLIWKGVEVTTGSQREHRYDRLLAQAVEKGVNPDTIRDYLNFFRYGMPPHGGYGLGLARLLMQLLGLKSIRDGSLLFRGPNRLTP
jgi:aspartyl-tRNA synthetase